MSLTEIVKSALSIALPEQEARIETGEVRIPQRELLRKTDYRLDLFLTTWEQECCTCYDMARWLLADASPQHGYNYYGMMEDSLR